MSTIIGVILTLCMLDGLRRLLDWAVWNPLKKHNEKFKREAKERMEAREAMDARSRDGCIPDPAIEEYCRPVRSKMYKTKEEWLKQGINFWDKEEDQVDKSPRVDDSEKH
jgi:hypothetical protein